MPVDTRMLRDRTGAADALRHPLDPLSAEEIAAAVRILRAERSPGPSIRFETVELKEPSKAVLRAYRPGVPVRREAFLAMFDVEADALFEAVVDLDEGKVTSWRVIEGARPTIMPEELAAVEQCVKADPRFAEALRRRGIEDVTTAQVDAWSAGSYGLADEEDVRVSHAFVWLKNHERDNGYAHPVEGLNVVVDINRLKVLRIDDYGGPPVPMAEHNYAARFQKRWRTDLKPLEIIQRDGPSFAVEGNLVRWQKWQIRVGFTGREGLVLHEVAYDDDGRLRSILYRASLAEMVVPYGDPTAAHYRKNAFDVGEYGIGRMTNSLEFGCDCLGVIWYFDAVVNNMAGEPIVIENAICLHEEDAGLLWKHWDWRTNEAEVRRSRRLVVSSIATVGNYEYAFYWYFYQDGTISFEVKLTGIINTAGCIPGAPQRFGTEVAPGVLGQIHQHIFNVRLDVAIDGEANSVAEVDCHQLAPGPENPHDNAFFATETLLATEKAARRRANANHVRHWKIFNPNRRNGLGQHPAYRLLPHGTVTPFTMERAQVSRRAAFIRNHLWVTPFAEEERFPAGPYVNQSTGDSGIDVWTERDRNVENIDVVVWHTFGHHHLPRPEDFPVQPAVSTGFTLQPFGFFDRNPALDVPPAGSSQSCPSPTEGAKP
jgi:primary-amine oxidase